MVKMKRIRVAFKDEEILSDAQKSEGLERCWVSLKPQERDTVSDVISYLLDSFQLRKSCPDGLLLSISGFVLPPFESSSILKDNEIVRVRKKRKDILSIEGKHDANEFEKPRNLVENGVLFFDFEKQKGVYEGDDPQEEDSDDVDEESDPCTSNRGPKDRKRKAEDKLLHPKKKKQCSVATGSGAATGIPEKLDNAHLDGETIDREDTNVPVAENADASDKDHVSDSYKKRNSDDEENKTDTPDVKLAPNASKKGPSRSARRKYAKRRWLREMAKIQKQNTTSESEGLRNWKEDQAKAKGKNMVHRSCGGLNSDKCIMQRKWTGTRDDLETNVQDDGPKGLLHWKPCSQNDQFCKGKKGAPKKGNLHKPPFHPCNSDKGKNQPQKGDTHEQQSPKNISVEEHQNGDAPEKIDERTDEEHEVVPIVIRPGHIRFEPLDEEGAVREDHEPSVHHETYQWNGITSKKKGQKWGKEDHSFTLRNSNDTNNSDVRSTEKEKQPDFDKFPSVDLPKEGDLIAYRVLELSSTWTPELSDYRVGKVSSYDAESNQTILLPVPEYPIFPEKTDEEEDENVLPDASLYKNDGSLEIEFSSLCNVRLVAGSSEPDQKDAKKLANGSTTSKEDSQSLQIIEAVSGSEHILNSVAEESKGNQLWEQLSEAVAAKKEQLSRWNQTPEMGLGNQRSWSYKALRGSGLGPAMAILRSKKHL